MRHWTQTWRESRSCMTKSTDEETASASLWPSSHGRSIDSPTVRHSTSPTEACRSTRPGNELRLSGRAAPSWHVTAMKWVVSSHQIDGWHQSVSLQSQADGGREERAESRSWSYYLYLAVRNHGVMHYMCSLLCKEFKGAQTEGNGMKNTLSTPFASHPLPCSHWRAAQAPRSNWTARFPFCISRRHFALPRRRWSHKLVSAAQTLYLQLDAFERFIGKSRSSIVFSAASDLEQKKAE